MANDLSAFQAEVWSNRLVDRLDQENIMLPLINRNYEGDLRSSKTVWIRTPGNISMAPYSRGTPISYQDLVPTKEAFSVNDGSYFAFEVDDFDKAQSDINALDAYMKRAVVTMNNVVEAKLLSAHAYTPGQAVISAAQTPGTPAALTATTAGGRVSAIAIGTAGAGYTKTPVITVAPPAAGGGAAAVATCTLTGGAISAVTILSGGWGYAAGETPAVTVANGAPITLTSDANAGTGIYQLFQAARATLSNNNVPQQGRWAIVSPNVSSIIMEDTLHFVRQGEMGDRIVQTGRVDGQDVGRTGAQAPGFIGEIAGFGVYETPHIPVDADGSKYLLFGDNDAITYASQITEIEALRLQTTFANAVRGLILHDTFVPAEATKRLVKIKVASTY